MKASEFKQALTVQVPLAIRDKAKRVFFDVGSQLYEAVVIDTPVDTGYLRASLAFTAGSESPDALAPPNKKLSYSGNIPTPGDKLKVAVEQFVPFTMGFRADYAVYVEDSHGMMKSAYVRAPQMIALAVNNAARSG